MGQCFTGLLEDFHILQVAETGGVGKCRVPSVTRLQRCCEKCSFPEQAKRSASLLSVLSLLYGGKEMVGEGFLMLSAILMLLAVRVRFGERTPCAFPFQPTYAVPGIPCLLRSEVLLQRPYRSKSGSCSVLFQVHVQLSCAIAWKLCLVNLMVLACSLRRGKNMQLQSFSEWTDPQKSKHASQSLDAKCCMPTTNCRHQDSRQELRL